MKLYEIDQAIENLIDKETGEILDFEQLESLQLTRLEKLENVALKVKNLMAESELIEAEMKILENEIKLLRDQRRSKLNNADRLKEYLLLALNGEKLKTYRCSVYYSTHRSVDIEDVHAAAEWLDANGHFDLVTYQAPTISKKELGKLLDEGTNIPGVSSAKKTTVIVR